MRIESSVISVSWIPSEAVKGLTAMPFDMGVAHYDEPPPDTVSDLAALAAGDRFRFANELRAWIEVDDGGRIVNYGHDGRGHIGSTTMRLGSRNMTFAAVPLPDLQPEPEVTDSAVRFRQTAGGRTGLPAPRRVTRPPFVQVAAPLAWTTLSLTISADGSSEFMLEGASPFPRHWVYDSAGALAAKSGLIDFKAWYRAAFGRHSPWGDEDSPALVTAVESALERRLSVEIMKADREPRMRKVAAGKTLVEQGDPGEELFLLLDGVLAVEVDGQVLAELGPGVVLGERAILEGGRRTSTLRAVTQCKVAVAPADAVDTEALREVSSGHRREEHPTT
jgi:hypothetical protein